ncbi:MAG: L-threonylcarbamoyladenylate synthase [Actinomycetota bacterium]|jgi:tRNA threonylcarbamoyl adenosine modification protein (Sua5/YciO/YrdC/YwlC family)
MIVPADADLDAAERALRAGQLVGIPTDTVYGLAVDAFGTGGADRLFAAKRRPREVDLPVLVTGPVQARSLATGIPDVALRLMERFWPGALTLVLPRSPDVTADLGDDEATIGVRCPDHDVARELCRRVGPLATTSANLHGQPTATTAGEVARLFGTAVALVLDGGTCAGSPSTVVDCTGQEPKLLREGRVPWTDITAV